jgi:hypothetical protein
MGGAQECKAWAVTVMRRTVVRLELPGFLHASPDWALADLRWYARRAHLEFATGLGGLGFDDRVMTCVLGSERDSRGGKKRSCLGTHVASSEQVHTQLIIYMLSIVIVAHISMTLAHMSMARAVLCCGAPGR